MQPAVYRNTRLLGKQVATIVLVGLSLSACGGSARSPSMGINADPSELDIGFTGSVGDGPVVNGTVRLKDVNGKVLYSGVSNENANYRLNGRVKRAAYPLVIGVSDGTDLVTGSRPDFELSAIVLESGTRTVNLNPFGTLVHKVVSRMPGGLTLENIALSKQIVISQLNFGLNSVSVSDPITTKIDTGNAATIVRSSEALGELIRRVRDRLIMIGRNMTADDVLDSIAADLVDGKVDGRGAAGADERIAALTTLISAQVIVETMANRLYVGGSNSTGRMDSAIRQIMGNKTPDRMTGDLTVTSEVLITARVGLDAFKNLDRDSAAVTLRNLISQIAPGDSSDDVAGKLPADSSDIIGGAIAYIVLASDAELEVVNATSRQGGGTVGNNNNPPEEPAPPEDSIPPLNTAPEINGTPATQVMFDGWYDFQPEASDAEGSALSFTIINRPGWLSFDTQTGRLSGIPTLADLGLWVDIRVSVNDGELSAELAAFAVNVLALPNSVPTISGVPATAATVGQAYSFQPAASDADGDELSFSITGMPAWASFNTTSGRLFGTPTATDAASSSSVVISVTDSKATVSLAGFVINVAGLSNAAPVISGTPASQITAGQLYSFVPSASDADGDSLSFSIDNRPAWASFNTDTGRLYGTPDADDVQSWSGIQIFVTDGVDSANLNSFSIAVEAVTGANNDVELTWVAPTHNEDGTILFDLAGYKLYYGRVGESLSESDEISNANATSYLFEGLDSGNWRFVVTAFNFAGQESRFSTEATYSTN